MGVYREGRADGGPREGADEVRWTNPGMVGAGGGGEWKSFFSTANPSLLGHHLKLCMEQEGKGTPLHVSHQPKDHKPRVGEGATHGACSPTGG